MTAKFNGKFERNQNQITSILQQQVILDQLKKFEYEFTGHNKEEAADFRMEVVQGECILRDIYDNDDTFLQTYISAYRFNGEVYVIQHRIGQCGYTNIYKQVKK